MIGRRAFNLHMTPFLQVDIALRSWIVLHRTTPLNGLMWGLSAVGRGGLVWGLIAAVLVAMRRLRPHALLPLALAIFVTSVIADAVMKPLIRRERPFVNTPEVVVIGHRPRDASFPSGHTANAFAGAFVLSRLALAPSLGWWILAGAIAYSRVYLGPHYPLDVIAGAIIGIACALATLAVVRPTVRPPPQR
jgi:undecaprenyl-diphosphatase